MTTTAPSTSATPIPESGPRCRAIACSATATAFGRCDDHQAVDVPTAIIINGIRIH